MKKIRFYVSDIREDLIKTNISNKSVLNIFGRFYDTEVEADSFIKENPQNNKYKIMTDGKSIIDVLNSTKGGYKTAPSEKTKKGGDL